VIGNAHAIYEPPPILYMKMKEKVFKNKCVDGEHLILKSNAKKAY